MSNVRSLEARLTELERRAGAGVMVFEQLCRGDPPESFEAHKRAMAEG